MVTVISQNASRVVLEGSIDGYPELTERWTVSVQSIANDPGLLVQVRDELAAKLEAKQAAWITAQLAIASL